MGPGGGGGGVRRSQGRVRRFVWGALRCQWTVAAGEWARHAPTWCKTARGVRPSLGVVTRAGALRFLRVKFSQHALAAVAGFVRKRPGHLFITNCLSWNVQLMILYRCIAPSHKCSGVPLSAGGGRQPGVAPRGGLCGGARGVAEGAGHEALRLPAGGWCTGCGCRCGLEGTANSSLWVVHGVRGVG